ncbi:MULTISPECIES: hypothetical protein [unclassified Mycobacterium]|uniref:hypothetical protein n=1 Tax=unclassified Mycobacterium TaxID=2642494 RepID=UPI0011159C51|nr:MULTISPECIES: hypothetical protein [unclassified Mycobacterium]
MRSNTGPRDHVDTLFGELRAALRRCVELPLDALTEPELWALLEHYDFLMGRLAVVKYELTSPFKP